MEFLNPCRVFKAPAEVDYFVDVSKLRRRNFFWNSKTRVLTVEVPELRLGSTNIDTSKIIFDDLDGVFIPASAMIELQQRSSRGAHAAAKAEAEKPENLNRARQNARVVIEALFERPIRIAGLNADVEVRFPSDQIQASEHWDVSRSLDEVLREAG